MKIVLLGDSITQGLGSKKINFTGELQALRCVDTIINMAMTGTTIEYAYEHLNEVINEKPDIVIILYGNVDAQIRPNRNGRIFKLLPPRFAHKDGSMLLPRPFYSKNWYKNKGQHIENIMRTVFREVIYVVDGKEQWLYLKKFGKLYTDVCTILKNNNIKVICCSTVYIDEELFCGSNEEYKKYNQCIYKISLNCEFSYLDLYNNLKKLVEEYGWYKIYNYDHFHPKGFGYKKMALWINEEIEKLRVKG